MLTKHSQKTRFARSFRLKSEIAPIDSFAFNCGKSILWTQSKVIYEENNVQEQNVVFLSRKWNALGRIGVWLGYKWTVIMTKLCSLTPGNENFSVIFKNPIQIWSWTVWNPISTICMLLLVIAKLRTLGVTNRLSFFKKNKNKNLFNNW